VVTCQQDWAATDGMGFRKTPEPPPANAGSFHRAHPEFQSPLVSGWLVGGGSR
jgi:hypothetical protein